MEAVAEPVRGRAQLALGIDTEVTGQVDHREQEVAHLAGERGRGVALHLLLDLARLSREGSIRIEGRAGDGAIPLQRDGRLSAEVREGEVDATSCGQDSDEVPVRISEFPRDRRPARSGHPHVEVARDAGRKDDVEISGGHRARYRYGQKPRRDRRHCPLTLMMSCHDRPPP